MRDRSASRRYSPAREEFRREHARHRVWGLAQRHAAKLRRLRGDCGGGGLVGASGSERGAVRPVPVAAPRGPAQVTAMPGADTAEPAAVSTGAAGDSVVSSAATGESVVAAGESVVLSVGPVVVASGSTVVAVGPAVAASGSAVAAGGPAVAAGGSAVVVGGTLGESAAVEAVTPADSAQSLVAAVEIAHGNVLRASSNRHCRPRMEKPGKALHRGITRGREIAHPGVRGEYGEHILRQRLTMSPAADRSAKAGRCRGRGTIAAERAERAERAGRPRAWTRLWRSAGAVAAAEEVCAAGRSRPGRRWSRRGERVSGRRVPARLVGVAVEGSVSAGRSRRSRRWSRRGKACVRPAGSGPAGGGCGGRKCVRRPVSAKPAVVAAGESVCPARRFRSSRRGPDGMSRVPGQFSGPAGGGPSLLCVHPR